MEDETMREKQKNGAFWMENAADETKERNMLKPSCSSLYPFVGICPHCHYDHGTMDFQWQQLRKAVSEFERTRCTCGVSTTLGVVHRADHVAFTCRAKKADPPEERDWPLCSCDPHAESIITALQEKNLAIVPGDLTLFPPSRDSHAKDLIIEGLRAEIAALVHQRDEARQECKQAVVAERERMCEIIKDHYWDSLNFEDIGKAHGVGLIKKIMESGNE
jgi:hypothetical protein